MKKRYLCIKSNMSIWKPPTLASGQSWSSRLKSPKAQLYTSRQSWILAQMTTSCRLISTRQLVSDSCLHFFYIYIYHVDGTRLTLYRSGKSDPMKALLTMGDGQQSQPLGTVRLEYTAGKAPQKFIETFQVSEGLPHDVIIGKPLLTAAHMMMVNPNFANPPNHPALCVLALPPKDKGKVMRKCNNTNAKPHNTASRAKAEALQKQRAAEQAAEYRAKLKAQGAPT